jgi:hypothetical protein
MPIRNSKFVICNSKHPNRELIRRMEAKVKAAIDRVWGAAS